jgi:tetratricopeptide (TPR) repeat protein
MMKIKKEAVVGVGVIVLIAAGIFTFLGRERDRRRDALAEDIAALNPKNSPPETIEGLRTAIRAYEAKIELHVKDAAQTGVYWKILAYRLQSRGLHGEALDALEHAISYNPEDAALHYQTGISAGIVAKSSLNFEGAPVNMTRDNYYALSEEGYLRAISLDGSYAPPLYGLGVLYVFELNRPREAVPYLLRRLEIGSDVDTMFVLARSYYMLGSYREAAEVYDRIVDFTRDPEKQNEARINRQLALDRIYG